MKAKTLLGIAVIALAGPICAQAGLVSYDVSYNGASAGTAGTAGNGSFGWDADTRAFTSFDWDFGGVAGALPSIDWDTSAFGGVLGQFLFEIMTGEDVHALGCSSVGCRFNFGMDVGQGSVLSAGFAAVAPGVSEYSFWLDSTLISSGAVSVTRSLTGPGIVKPGLDITDPVTSFPPDRTVQIPAPAPVGLLGIGLLGFVFGRKVIGRSSKRLSRNA